MKSKVNILNAVKYVSGIVLLIGIMNFSIGFFVSGFSVLTPIGIGAVVGAVFVFLMGIFFVATEEMINKDYAKLKVISIKMENGAPDNV
ncbi:hypothetical protein [Bacillus sp. FJAT-42315]|uniref:hypothetical protein n=1 Tax=Bacillus sp. FJAT-42315 TaxID=2014077 RepID=UPI000BA9A3FF|nr:hypothetical protein [Bacillus sp. FJAT-42315]PAQ14954.1 hypothetical protein CD798_08685 [Bacillaceae bacterium SAOS 7]